MYPHQAEQLTGALERAGVEALVATTPENLFYITGFRSLLQATYRGLQLFGIFSPRGTAMVLPAADTLAAAVEGVDVDHVRCYGRLFLGRSERPDAAARRAADWLRAPADDALGALAAALDALGVGGRVGVDEDGLSPVAWRRAVERLGGSRVVEGAKAFGEARRTKGPWEIECLDRALRIAEEATNEVIQALKPGVTEREAAAQLHDGVSRRGADPHSVVLLFGDRSALPAVRASGRPLRVGDLARFDVGCTYRGYHAQLGRTAVAGEPDEAQQHVHDAVQQGLEAALDIVAPGASCGAVFERAVVTARRAGLPEYDRVHIGHGIGLEPYERPRLTGASTARLEAGMILILQASYYEPGWGGVGVKDTVLVTMGGCQVMNRSLRGLVVLD